GQTQLSLALSGFNALIGYRRIQPDFKSLGVPYMINDVELINGHIGAQLFKGKWSLNATYSTQHNNLEKLRSTELNTNTGNFSTSIFFNQNFILNANFTGVEVYQKDGLQQLSDSIRVDQLMWTLNVVPSLNFTNTSLQHTVSSSFTHTQLNDRNPMTQDQTDGNNLNVSGNYSLYFEKNYF